MIWMLAGLFTGLQAQTKVELFCGADLSYADVNYIRLYDVLLNLPVKHVDDFCQPNTTDAGQ